MGYAICAALFSEVRVRAAWSYGVKRVLMAITFFGLPHTFHNRKLT